MYQKFTRIWHFQTNELKSLLGRGQAIWYQNLKMRYAHECIQTAKIVATPLEGLSRPELFVGPISSTYTQPNPSQSENFGHTNQPKPQPISNPIELHTTNSKPSDTTKTILIHHSLHHNANLQNIQFDTNYKHNTKF